MNRFARALPGTLGVLALVFLPVVGAVSNLGAGLAALRRPTAPAAPAEEGTALVATYDVANGGWVLNPRTRIRARGERARP